MMTILCDKRGGVYRYLFCMIWMDWLRLREMIG